MSDAQVEKEELAREIDTLIDGDRIIGFSDAIFAFAATLLVLKIDLPRIAPDLIQSQFFTELGKLWPAYAANFISFIVIAYYWRVHHKLFILIKRYDNIVVWLNILVLIAVSFLPFPIDLFGDYSSVAPVILFYTLSIGLVGVLLLILWLYASHNHRLIDKNMSPHMIRYHTLSNSIAPLVFLLSTPIAYFDHAVAKMSWLMMIILLFLLNTFYGSHRKSDRIDSPVQI